MRVVQSGPMARQNFDADPPRCVTCVYFRREPHSLHELRQVKTRRGKVKTIKVPKRKDAVLNPVVDRCSYGNFMVKPHSVCDEWHSRSGETVERES